MKKKKKREGRKEGRERSRKRESRLLIGTSQLRQSRLPVSSSPFSHPRRARSLDFPPLLDYYGEINPDLESRDVNGTYSRIEESENSRGRVSRREQRGVFAVEQKVIT